MSIAQPDKWIRVSKYLEDTGETLDAVYDRIRDGQWAAGKHYKRTGPRTLWINYTEAQAWVANRPHVEAGPFPRGSNSGKESAALA